MSDDIDPRLREALEMEAEDEAPENKSLDNSVDLEKTPANVLVEVSSSPTVLKYDYTFESCYTRENPGKPMMETDVLHALNASRGIVSEAAKLLGRSNSTVTNYIAKSDYLRAYSNDCRERLISKAEANIFRDVEMGDATASKFILTTLGKNRGYTTRAEHTGADGDAIEVNQQVELQADQFVFLLGEMAEKIPPAIEGEEKG